MTFFISSFYSILFRYYEIPIESQYRHCSPCVDNFDVYTFLYLNASKNSQILFFSKVPPSNICTFTLILFLFTHKIFNLCFMWFYLNATVFLICKDLFLLFCTNFKQYLFLGNKFTRYDFESK